MPSGWKNPVHRALNLAMWLALCGLAGTAWILWQRLPAGVGGYRGGRGSAERARAVLGLTRHDWADWHAWIAVGFVVLGLAHLWLNRVWLRKVAASNHGWRLWAGLGAGAALGGVLALG
jgi:hypothetical protein